MQSLSREMDRRAAGGPGSTPAAERRRPTGYLAATRTATYAFLATLPLLVLYEVGVVLANDGVLSPIRVGADIWLKTLLATVGATGWMAIGGAVLVVGAGVVWAERERRPPLKAAYFGGIVAESAVYGVALAWLVGGVVGALFGMHLLFGASASPLRLAALMQPIAELDTPLQLALSIGAGLYEELVFRVLLVGGLFRVLSPWMGRRGATPGAAYAVAALIGALLFSAVHYVGPLGDAFGGASFTFRFLFGLALNALFLLRGFAVAAWTHALYDVYVVMLSG